MDLATWGAITGTIGTLSGGFGAFFAVRREIRASRLRLHLGQLTYLSVSRHEPVGLVTAAWAGVFLRNAGGRPLAVEHVGLEFAVPVGKSDEMVAAMVRGEIYLDEPVEPAPDDPIRRIYTPLGPLLAAGFDPLSPLTQAWAKTSDGREWRGAPEPWLQQIPPGSTKELVGRGILDIAHAAEAPPMAGGLVWLDKVIPVLPDGPPSRDPPRADPTGT